VIFKGVIVISCALLLIGCAGSSKNIEIDKYQKRVTKKVFVDEACKKYYKTKKPTVAVLSFTNNSNFSSANSKIQNKKASASIGVGIASIGAKAKSDNYTNSRIVDPKLSKAFVSSIENMLVDLGSVNVITRVDMDKVDKELKYQDSGLLNPDSLVQFGLTSGVQYIITGSIDFVKHNFKNPSRYTSKVSHAMDNVDSTELQLAANALDLATSFFDGTQIEAGVTLKIIEVSTGKVVFAKQVVSETTINGKREPHYDELVGTVKHSVVEALPSLKEELSNLFTTYGYITKIKKSDNDDYIVQVNLGVADGLKEGSRLEVESIDINEDPLGEKRDECVVNPTNIKLEATHIISNNFSWTIVAEGDAKKLKVLQLVKRIKE